MKIISVNHVLENLEKYTDMYIYLYGLLIFEFENISICHLPRNEIGNKNLFDYSIWLRCENNLCFEEHSMKKLSGKSVLVEGKVVSPDSKFGGCGHLSGWAAEIVATDIELYKA